MNNFFKFLYQSKKTYLSAGRSKARLGEIKTSHGVIKTPSFVTVGTKGTIKSLVPSFLKEIKTQVAFVNTYHLVTHPGVEIIEKAGGIHNYSGLNIPLMSDSGGFQVFSLARKKNQKSKFKSLPEMLRASTKQAGQNDDEKLKMIKISDDGVKFRSIFDGSIIEFTPEKSMEYQRKIGTDILMAFDECIPYGVDYQYTKEATERTHQWLKRCIKFKDSGSKFLSHESLTPPRAGSPRKRKNFSPSFLSNLQPPVANHQYLYGIIQGGVFEDLRKKSAEFVVSQNVDGVAIGGVSVGESKKEMRDQVAWICPYLPKDKPVHLLGVGQFDDILDLVRYGIDTFDCVEPTRLARMGSLYQIKNLKFKSQNNIGGFEIEKIDILKGRYRHDLSAVDENCRCYVCQNFTKSYLHHLFKTKELLAYTLATYHNLWVMEKLFEEIREMIGKDLI